MVTRQLPARARLLAELGTDITTLRAPERGTGSPQLDSVLAVLTILGIVNTVVAARTHGTRTRAARSRTSTSTSSPLSRSVAGRARRKQISARTPGDVRVGLRGPITLED